MSEEANQPIPSTTGSSEGQGVGVMLDERDLRSIYVNSYRIHAAQEEVVLDLIFSMPNPNPAAAQGNAQMLWKVTDRAIMSYASAKRLAMSLGQLVKRYEQQFGEIPMGGPKR